jgi:hypothetical protein
MANVSATLTCPHCGHEAHEIMPTDRCIVVYDCPACARTLRPKTADCCVFCSYADRPCPPVQDSELEPVNLAERHSCLETAAASIDARGSISAGVGSPSS